MTEDEVLMEQEDKKDSKEEGTSVLWRCSHGPHRYKNSQPWGGRSLLSPAPWAPQSLPPWSALFSLLLSQLHPQQISATLAALKKQLLPSRSLAPVGSCYLFVLGTYQPLSCTQ